jgi:hypothetical protein
MICSGHTTPPRGWADPGSTTCSWLGEPRRSTAARRVRRHLNDGGGRAGALALGVAVLALWLAPPVLQVPRPGWASVAVLLLAAVGGKLLGLTLSRRRLRGELRRLAAGADARPAARAFG